MKKKIILLSQIRNNLAAMVISNNIIEAAVFLAIRMGAKKMMIVQAGTYELLSGEEEYEQALSQTDAEVEVMVCDTESPEILELAELNSQEHKKAASYPIEHINPMEFVRDVEHMEHLPYEDNEVCEGTEESYEKFDRVLPLFYVQFLQDGKVVRAVVDGWKYIQFAKKEGKETVIACRLLVGNNDDLVHLMLQLQNSNHNTFLALFYMIMALWKKYAKGRGHRSDLDDAEANEAMEGPDGKKLTIYERIGLELHIKPHRVKYLRRIGMTSPLELINMEADRTALYKSYGESVRRIKGELPSAPQPKPVVTSATRSVPDTRATTTSNGSNGEGNYSPAQATGDVTSTVTVAGTVVSRNEHQIVIKAICPHCNKPIFITIPKSELYEESI